MLHPGKGHMSENPWTQAGRSARVGWPTPAAGASGITVAGAPSVSGLSQNQQVSHEQVVASPVAARCEWAKEWGGSGAALSFPKSQHFPSS